MRTAFVACKSLPPWRFVAALLFLALAAGASRAGEKAGLRLRGAGTEPSAPEAALSRDEKAPDKYGALNGDAPGPGTNVASPDTVLWNGEEDFFSSPFAEPASGEGTASFMNASEPNARRPDLSDAPRREAAGRENPFTTPSPKPGKQDRMAMTASAPYGTPQRRGIRLRKKKADAEGNTIFGPSARDRQRRSEEDAPEFEPGVPPLVAGMTEEDAPRDAAPQARMPDASLDNTSAKKQDQEREMAKYDRDGRRPEAAAETPREERGPVANAPKTFQPATIPSNPPPARDDAHATVNDSGAAIASPSQSTFPGGVAPAASMPRTAVVAQQAIPPRRQAMAPPPTRVEVEDYRRRLELRLLERYNNLPEHAGNVGRVTVVLSKPLQLSLDGEMIRAEFDQLVFDPWGKRIPALEEEYYVVTFGAGGARQVRADPSIRVGLDLEKAYSERAPLNADPFNRVPEDRAFRPAPTPESATAAVKMPEWWRPDFPELQ